MSILYLSDKEKGFEEKSLNSFDIESIQGLVNGSPEALYLPDNIVIWKNPRAAVLNQEKTLVLKHEGELNDYIYGEVVVTGTDGTKTIALSEDQKQEFRNKLEEVEVEGEKLPAVDY
ncbi:DUF3846 domain-containing protein [Salipaludibacillus aurantiacus]|uniref:DUF3846 domain-containing protein n=1 Tax=Salipaludibacillus aurantiacus TaxID=1601833 RepID=A0A1H9Q5E9_9BACI|nr:DUF3846 domain-containing protein [Salipaludibacillus aurantiacus]SER55786.1 hypothetical protein SAMN05518684_10251 [Salipaludibacillus aurantiacus]